MVDEARPSMGQTQDIVVCPHCKLRFADHQSFLSHACGNPAGQKIRKQHREPLKAGGYHRRPSRSYRPPVLREEDSSVPIVRGDCTKCGQEWPLRNGLCRLCEL